MSEHWPMVPIGEALELELDHVANAPTDSGVLDLIVRRPAVDEREVLELGVLDETDGLVGDSWRSRGDAKTADGSADPRAQLNLMCSRVAALVAGPRERWALAGDQLFVDFDLAEASTPAGTRLAIGEAVIEITPKPHRGCAKFAARFGVDALRLVNSPVGITLNLRGRNARVIRGGRIRTGDAVTRVSPDPRA
jgi:hypothetical protein